MTENTDFETMLNSRAIILVTIPASVYMSRAKPRKISVSIASDPAEIRTSLFQLSTDGYHNTKRGGIVNRKFERITVRNSTAMYTLLHPFIITKS